MEERDVQIRGYKIRLPLDVFVVATANPEDYTNRGRIITPLKDRFGAEVRTHYPKTAETELAIVDQERLKVEDGELRLTVPFFMEEIIAEITTLARRSPDVNQRSGVSVRVSIANYETMVANATRRAIRTNEREIVPRPSDLPSVASSTGGKIELESLDENKDNTVVDRLIRNAVLNVFNRYFRVQEFEEVVTRFDQGKAVDVSDALGAADAMRQIGDFLPDVRPALKKIGCDESPAAMASGAEFIFEGLHLNKKLNKDKVAGTTQYRGAVR
jgi:magnesium chelatase subunit I